MSGDTPLLGHQLKQLTRTPFLHLECIKANIVQWCHDNFLMGGGAVAYSELVKNFAGIREYMRQFFVYGFKTRDEFDAKSARSYDNEKRRVESWLSDYMAFRQDANGKAVFLSVDSRHIPTNPLYKAWKASSFTRNDISLHFILLDILSDGSTKALPELLNTIDKEYLSAFLHAEPIDESTLRKKLKEYAAVGLINARKQGKQLVYSLPESKINLDAWKDAIAFFAEDNPLGVVGGFLLDKYDHTPALFTFKHRYLLFTLDSGIMLELLMAIHEHRRVALELVYPQKGQAKSCSTLPLKIFISVQGGRQYLAAYDLENERVCFFRLDNIQKVKHLESIGNYDTYQARLREERAHIWGVATGQGQMEHIEMTLKVEQKDMHIVHRLQREKRCGAVEQLDDVTWRFYADVYDALELMPWLRTFIGRITSLTCSNKRVEEQFWADFSSLADLYGGDGSAF